MLFDDDEIINPLDLLTESEKFEIYIRGWDDMIEQYCNLTGYSLEQRMADARKIMKQYKQQTGAASLNADFDKKHKY